MQNLVKRKIEKQSGYTLVELMVVVMLLFLVISIITVTYFTTVNASRLVIDTTAAEIDARTAMYSVSKQIRGATLISAADTDHIAFISGQHGDARSYFLQTGQQDYHLYESYNGQEKILATNIIDSSLFTYYSSPQMVLDTPVSSQELDDIGIIGINIVIDKAGESSERTMELDTFITLRNK